MRYYILILFIYFWTLPLWATPLDTEKPLPEIHLIIKQPGIDECTLGYPSNLQDKILHILQPQTEQKKSLLEFLEKLSEQDLRQFYKNLYSLIETIEANQPISATRLTNGMEIDIIDNLMLENLIENFPWRHSQQSILLPKTWQIPPNHPHHIEGSVMEHENVIAPQVPVMVRQHQNQNDNSLFESHHQCCCSINHSCTQCYEQINPKCVWCFCNTGIYSCAAVFCILGFQNIAATIYLPTSLSCLLLYLSQDMQ